MTNLFGNKNYIVNISVKFIIKTILVTNLKLNYNFFKLIYLLIIFSL